MSTEKISEYVTLVSNDGFEFKLLRSAACIAGTIKRALNPECTQLVIPDMIPTNNLDSWFPRDDPEPHGLPNHQVRTHILANLYMCLRRSIKDAWLTIRSGVVLEKVCEYLYYNQKHAESKEVSDMDIPPELCLELLIAADYLDGKRTFCLRFFRMLTPYSLNCISRC